MFLKFKKLTENRVDSSPRCSLAGSATNMSAQRLTANFIFIKLNYK